MKIIAVIQARLNSTRLPRKVLLPLAGKSMLQNVVERVSRAKRIERTIVNSPCSDAREISDAANALVHHPAVDENDLIARLLATAHKFEADFIIRICADNPCVEGKEIDSLISYYNYTYPWRLYMNSENKNFHDGFGGEFYPIAMLEWMDKVVKFPEYREHPHKFWIDIEADNYCGKDYPEGFRLDVNTQADYEKVKSIYDHFGHNKFSVKEAMEFLEHHQAAN